GGSDAVVASTTSARPIWLQLTRTGTTLAAAISADGTIWSQIGTVTMAMASAADVGLIACSHDTTVSTTATFDNVAVTQGAVAMPPGSPTAPSASDAATSVAASATLTWSATSATTYDVKFGASNPPAQVSTAQTPSSYSPG